MTLTIDQFQIMEPYGKYGELSYRPATFDDLASLEGAEIRTVTEATWGVLDVPGTYIVIQVKEKE